MTNAAQADAFGMEPPREPQWEGDQLVEPNEPSGKSSPDKKKSTPIPTYVWAILGVVVVLAIGLIITVFIKVVSANQAKAQNAMRRAQVVESSAENATVNALTTELSGLKAAITALQESNLQLRTQVSQLAQGQDTRAVERRVEVLESNMTKLGTNVTAMVRKVNDAKPMDTDLTSREDVRLVSVGAGVARIADKSEREQVLRKGDRWNGLIVREVRADRGVVVLSDGTIIR